MTWNSRRLKRQIAFWINTVDRIILAVPVEVDAAPVAQRVARQEPAHRRAVEAVRQQRQARLCVRVVPKPRSHVPRARRVPHRLRPVPPHVVLEHIVRVAAPVQRLHRIAPVVIVVEDRCPSCPPRDQPVRPEDVGRGQCARAGVLAHRLRAVIQEVRPAPARLFPRPQIVPAVAVRLDAAIAGQPVLRVEGQSLAPVGRRVAVAIIAVAAVRDLVVGVEGVRGSLKARRVARPAARAARTAGRAVVAVGVGVAAVAGAALLRELALVIGGTYGYYGFVCLVEVRFFCLSVSQSEMST